jgi:hypothetical protein
MLLNFVSAERPFFMLRHLKDAYESNREDPDTIGEHVALCLQSFSLVPLEDRYWIWALLVSRNGPRRAHGDDSTDDTAMQKQQSAHVSRLLNSLVSHLGQSKNIDVSFIC